MIIYVYTPESNIIREEEFGDVANEAQFRADMDEAYGDNWADNREDLIDLMDKENIQLISWFITTENDTSLDLYADLTPDMGFKEDSDVLALETNFGEICVSLDKPYHHIFDTPEISIEIDNGFIDPIMTYLLENGRHGLEEFMYKKYGEK